MIRQYFAPIIAGLRNTGDRQKELQKYFVARLEHVGLYKYDAACWKRTEKTLSVCLLFKHLNSELQLELAAGKPKRESSWKQYAPTTTSFGHDGRPKQIGLYA